MPNPTRPRSEKALERSEGQSIADLDLSLDETMEVEAAGETAGSEPDVRISADTGLDRIVGPEEAGLGGGLDQAEEAQLGVTDEELAEMARRRGRPEK